MNTKKGERLPIEQRLAAKVQYGDLASCWLWVGSVDGDGYGCIAQGGRGGRVLGAHRISWEIANGPVPDGMELDHLCRVRRCVNPGHLEPVDHGTNVRRGGLAKLTFEQVEAIRFRRNAGEGAKKLAVEFGITREYVWRIANSDTRAIA